MTIKKTFIIVTCLLLGFCASSQKKMQKERENSPRYQYNLGIFYLNNGQLDQSIIHLNKTITLKSDYALAYDGLGLVYFMKRELDKAVNNFNKCLAIDATITDAHNHLGSVYQEMGLLDKAKLEFLTAVNDKSYHSRELPYYNLARLHQIQENFPKALEFINQAIFINSKYIMAHNLKALILEQLEKFGDAIKSYQLALELVKKYSQEDTSSKLTLQYNLAGAYFKNKEYNKAKQIFLEIQSLAISEEMKANITKYLNMIKNIGAKILGLGL